MRVLAMLYIPNNCVGTKILFVGPDNPVLGRTDQTKVGFIEEFLKSASLQIRFDVKHSRDSGTCLNFDPIIIEWYRFDDFLHATLLLSKRINFKNRFTSDRQFPVYEQIFPVYLDPCLNQIEFGHRLVASENRTIIDSDRCLLLAIFGMNMRAIVFFVVVEVHQD
jgi:hypothetical protein